MELVPTQPSFLAARSMFALHLHAHLHGSPELEAASLLEGVLAPLPAQHLPAEACTALDTPNLLGYSMPPCGQTAPFQQSLQFPFSSSLLGPSLLTGPKPCVAPSALRGPRRNHFHSLLLPMGSQST